MRKAENISSESMKISDSDLNEYIGEENGRSNGSLIKPLSKIDASSLKHKGKNSLIPEEKVGDEESLKDDSAPVAARRNAEDKIALGL
mmetsp:Transcript_37728/g.57769  ORF Transcript_37728/g.57769 Transcript_37728/m.57769 type:complete len:88 (+) Transcript_37728:1467-1730(+)